MDSRPTNEIIAKLEPYMNLLIGRVWMATFHWLASNWGCHASKKTHQHDGGFQYQVDGAQDFVQAGGLPHAADVNKHQERMSTMVSINQNILNAVQRAQRNYKLADVDPKDRRQKKVDITGGCNGKESDIDSIVEQKRGPATNPKIA